MLEYGERLFAQVVLIINKTKRLNGAKHSGEDSRENVYVELQEMIGLENRWFGNAQSPQIILIEHIPSKWGWFSSTSQSKNLDMVWKGI